MVHRKKENNVSAENEKRVNRPELVRKEEPEKDHQKQLEELKRDTVSHTRFLVEDAIKRQMVSDVPVCTFLSFNFTERQKSTAHSR